MMCSKQFDQREIEKQLQNRILSKSVVEYNPANESIRIKVEWDGN